MRPRRLLLTGASGFAGAHVLRHVLTNTDWEVVCPVTFRHRGNSGRIASSLEGRDEWQARVRVVMHDLAGPLPSLGSRVGYCDYVIAMAAESHVDRSIANPVSFIRNNTDVMLSTMEYCREELPRHVILVSTDEVYGPVRAGQAGHPEWSPVIPSNPYSASKACQEAIGIAYWRTYGVPLTIVNTMNLIGQMQDPEKFLPSLISNINAGREVVIHGREGDIGSRHYMHARNLADALLFLIAPEAPAMFPEAGQPNRFNIAGPDRISNLKLAQQVATIVGKPLHARLVDFHHARPGHDPHYGLDTTIIDAAWKPPIGFYESLETTVNWSLAHPEWLTRH